MRDWLNKTHTGDVRAVLREMIADGVKVQTIVTSPPYWGLRSYLPAGHPDKALEIGSEPTLREFLDTMVGVFDLARQVLADDGTMWVNMGDSYARAPEKGGSGPGGKNAEYSDSYTEANTGRRNTNNGLGFGAPGLKPKDLVGQPWRLAFALQDAGWYLRQDIIWHKPNPMPESIKDRCTKSHEYIFLMAKSERYHFDVDAIAEPAVHPEGSGNVRPVDTPPGWRDGENANIRGSLHKIGARPTRNKRTVWTVPTKPYAEAHFATFPPALIEPCILAGAPVGGIVLDIFMGSGTTAQVAQALGRNYIGIDIDARNERLQSDRTRQPSFPLEQAMQ